MSGGDAGRLCVVPFAGIATEIGKGILIGVFATRIVFQHIGTSVGDAAQFTVDPFASIATAVGPSIFIGSSVGGNIIVM